MPIFATGEYNITCYIATNTITLKPMNIKFKISVLLVFVTILLSQFSASAQKFSIGTNGFDWASLGTINAEIGFGINQHFSIHAGAEVNPWTFNKDDQEKEFQLRHISYWAGLRWWPWHIYSGWWAGGDLRYSVYNLGGVFERATEEGDAWGVGLYGGYSIMLNEWLNLDFGAGLWGGYKQYTRYACPVCGVKTDKGNKAFVVPDARVALMFVF